MRKAIVCLVFIVLTFTMVVGSVHGNMPTGSLTFKETGLPPGTSWGIIVGSQHYCSFGSDTIDVTNLPIFTTTHYGVDQLTTYCSTPTEGDAQASVSGNIVTVTFSPENVYFIESGAAINSYWSVTINGETHSAVNYYSQAQYQYLQYQYGVASPRDTISFSLPNGVYSFSVGSSPSNPATPTSGIITVNNDQVTKEVVFGASSFLVQAIDPAGVTQSSLTLCNNEPSVSYTDNQGNLKFASYDDNQWSIQTIGQGTSSSLVLDRNGHPYITYVDSSGNLGYAAYATSWSTNTIAYYTGSGLWWGYSKPSIALDLNGYPCITAFYTDDGSKYSLQYWYLYFGTWTSELIASNSAGETVHGSLAFDSTGAPHISYSFGSWTGDNVQYASYDYGTNKWHANTVSTDNGVMSSLVLDSSNNPHISYVAGQSLKYAYSPDGGSTWQIQTLATYQNSWGWDYYYASSSIAIDSQGYPHIAARTGILMGESGLNYLSWNGNAWDIQSVTVNGPSHTVPDYQHVSLALTSNDYPYISADDLQIAHSFGQYTPYSHKIVSSGSPSTTSNGDTTFTVDDTSTSGVAVVINGITAGTQLTVSTVNYGTNQPSGTPLVSIDGATFYDVRVTSITTIDSGATAVISITNPAFTGVETMSYLDQSSNTWLTASNKAYDSTTHTLSGTVPVSALTGTPFFVTPEYTLGALLALVACFAAFAVVKIREKRLTQHSFSFRRKGNP